jgi:aryl-alcohol dehydrogenase-like predicted oxidoreductase
LEKRAFGKTGLEITPIGFGSWAIGGSGWRAAWGPQDDDEAVEAIRRAVELGMNWINTAAVYGLGHSEELVARALKGGSERPYVFTKCSLVWDENGDVHNVLKKDSVKHECEGSLRRLQTDVIDLYQEGKVRHIGVSNFDVSQMERIQEIVPVETLQPPYNMLNRGIEEEILTPESAGWEYVGFEVVRLDAGRTLERDTGSEEVCLVVLSGRCDVFAEQDEWRGIGE